MKYLPRHNTGVGAIPSTNSLLIGELAINTTEGRLFTQIENNSIIELTPAVIKFASGGNQGYVFRDIDRIQNRAPIGKWATDFTFINAGALLGTGIYGADGNYSYAGGLNNRASGYSSHAEGFYTTASGGQAHAEGHLTEATGTDTHSEGHGTIASGSHAHAEGHFTSASGSDSHSEGHRSTASGYASHAEGYKTTASGSKSHTEGHMTTASGSRAHAEGHMTTASGYAAHAEGYKTTASGYGAHAAGFYSISAGDNSWTTGMYNLATTTASMLSGYANLGSQYQVQVVSVTQNIDGVSTDITYTPIASQPNPTITGIMSMYSNGPAKEPIMVTPVALSGNIITVSENLISSPGVFTVDVSFLYYEPHDLTTNMGTLINGSYNLGLSQNSVTSGYQLISKQDNSLVFGSYNIGQSISTICEVGGGYIDTVTNLPVRLNLFEIHDDGRVLAPEQTLTLHNDVRCLTTKEYVDTTVSNASGGAVALNDLTDVDILTTPPAVGDVLMFDGTSWVPGAKLVSDPTGIVGATTVSNIVQISQLDYNNIVTPDPSTVYIING
jgi:hypothetical protein